MNEVKKDFLPTRYEERPPQVLISREGKWMCIRQELYLYEKLGHIYSVSGKWKITADGYDVMNRIAGVTFFNPQYLILGEDQRVANPYVEKDSYGNIRRITCRVLGVGYSRTGVLTVNDTTVTFDLEKYFKKELMGLTKGFKGKSKKDGKDFEIPAVGKITKKDLLTEDEIKNGLCYVIEPEQNVVVYVPLDHWKTKEVLTNKVEREKFAGRIASRLTKRTCLSQHPCIGMSSVEADGPAKDAVAVVEVYGWIYQETPGQMLRKAIKYDEERRQMEGFFGEEPPPPEERELPAVETKIISEEVSEPEFVKTEEIAEKEAGEGEVKKSKDFFENAKGEEFLNSHQQGDLFAKCSELKLNWSQFKEFIAHLKPDGYSPGQELKNWNDIKKAWLKPIYEAIEEYSEDAKAKKAKNSK